MINTKDIKDTEYIRNLKFRLISLLPPKGAEYNSQPGIEIKKNFYFKIDHFRNIKRYRSNLKKYRNN